ncbi:MAG: DUF262 domain-containing protein [Candidatus Poribacteria bacterium]|nr:DUF262 domain-containing protein [Candidatus Poribacteria bacterium]
MNVDRKTVNSLFKVAVQYEIPMYQRRYVWNEDHWHPLWSDIVNNAEGKSERHFTGAIVTRLIPSERNRGTLDKYEIIDGQQRLTTFQLILCAFRDLCRSGDYDDKYDLAGSAEEHIKNPSSDVDGDLEHIEGDSIRKSVYKLLPTDYDSKAFRMLVNSQGANTEHFIHKAYLYFRDRIKDYVNGDYNKIRQLVNSTIDRFEVAQINLERTDQSQEIFLSINATGRRLSEFDYLRNYIFLRSGGKEECEKLYRDSWYKFETNPWTTKKLNEFFPVFLLAKQGPKVFQNDTKLFDLYQKEYLRSLPDDEQTPQHEVAQLELYAEAYKELDDSLGIGSRMQFYKDLGTYEEADSHNSSVELQHNRNIACVQSFILHLKNELDRPYRELYKVFDILESYVARRLLVDTVDSRYAYETIEIFFREIINGSRQFTVENLVQYLNRDGRRKWISNNEVLRRFKESGNREQGAGRRFQGSLLFTERYILYRIENLKRKRAGEDELRFEEFCSTQERMLNSRSLSKRAWASLGNATFRTGNSSRPEINLFEQEKKLLGSPDNAILLLNREICDHDDWKDEDVDERESDLLDCFYELWPAAERFTEMIVPHSTGPKFRYLKWDTKIQSVRDQQVRFDTYNGPEILSKIKIVQDKVSGINKKKEQRILNKSDILFISFQEAWTDLRNHCVSWTAVRAQDLQPVLEPTEQFQIDETLLQSALVDKSLVTVFTRLGRELPGKIEMFNDDAIYLEIEGHEVTVFRSGLLECWVEGVYNGIVEKWGPNDLYGYIECEKQFPGLRIEVKSEFLNPDILSRKLQPGLKVKFNKIVQKDGNPYFQAHNVELITVGQLHQGKVEWFKPDMGSGFLTSESYPFNVYVHKSQVEAKDINSLRAGQLVEFKIAETVEGQNSVAVDVQVKRNKR